MCLRIMAHTRQMKKQDLLTSYVLFLHGKGMGMLRAARPVSRNLEIVELGCSNPFNLTIVSLLQVLQRFLI